MPNVLLLIPADLYRTLPVELRAELVAKAELVAIAETETMWRVDKTAYPAVVPDHIHVGDIGTYLDTGEIPCLTPTKDS